MKIYKTKESNGFFRCSLSLLVCHKARNTIDENIFRLCGVQTLTTLVELKAAKTHTVLYQINRTEYYCQVDLPLSDYPLYGKQLVASRG